jgi:predicted metal-binding protein
MKISEIRQTMVEKGIPTEIVGQFIFPETDDETSEEKVTFAAQMDKLLTKEQILSIMEEQGCSKHEHPELWLKLKGKSIEERIKILNAMSMNEYPRTRLNDDGTLSVFWHYGKTGKYKCVCSIINNLRKPQPVSITFCGCCSGHVKYHSENSLGVKLRLIETVSSPISSNGEKYCEHLFEIAKGKGDEQG